MKSFLIFALSVLILVSCGQPICVAGIGQCDNISHVVDNKSSDPTQPLKILSLNSETQIESGERITFRISGGRSPYTVGIIEGPGEKPVVSGNSEVTYTAPTVYDRTAVTIRVVDEDKKQADNSFFIYPKGK